MIDCISEADVQSALVTQPTIHISTMRETMFVHAQLHSILQGRRFAARHADGPCPDAVFQYEIERETVTGQFAGGVVRAGHLTGVATAFNTIEFVYHYITLAGEIAAGWAHGRVAITDAGRGAIDLEWGSLIDRGKRGRMQQIEIGAR